MLYILGVLYAILAVDQGWNDFTIKFISPFGTIFINVLKLIAVPMVLFSIITGITSLKNIKQLGRVGVKTLLIYIGTTVTAVLIGLFLVNSFKPGRSVTDNTNLEKRIEYELWQREHAETVPSLIIYV